jgi:hypothetical protein
MRRSSKTSMVLQQFQCSYPKVGSGESVAGGDVGRGGGVGVVGIDVSQQGGHTGRHAGAQVLRR